jgi:tetrahydromethanopterin S-methyltransferase subunit B
MMMAMTTVTTEETLAMTTLSGCIRCVVRLAVTASVDECFQAMEAMRQRMEDLERVVEDDYKFLNRNVRKLFGMVGNMKGKWCNSCGKYH